MQQVIVIHGGTTFYEYNAYLTHLAEKKVTLDRLLYKPLWKELLQENLGDTYQVLLPKMPNTTNARYKEWSIWFENISNLFTDDCILVGHSMGAIFLAKYLSEHTMQVKIKAAILIATPYDDESVEDLTDFKIEHLSERLTEQAGKIIIVNGDDDPVISQSDVEKYKAALPSAEFISLSAPDHFVRRDFPELLELINNI